MGSVEGDVVVVVLSDEVVANGEAVAAVVVFSLPFFSLAATAVGDDVDALGALPKKAVREACCVPVLRRLGEREGEDDDMMKQ